MHILGIETSCDETAAAVVEVRGGQFAILSSVVASQILIHQKTGGVVPEVAAREHTVTVIPTVQAALELAGVWTAGSWSTRPGHARARGMRASAQSLHVQTVLRPNIDLIAATAGPGLITSLLVGAETGRTLSYAWNIPFVAVNHIAGHLYSSLLMNQPIRYPALALIVSGGHTELQLLKKKGQLKCLGTTRDDAAGEAFDKTAKLLGYPYPGGPALSRAAEGGNPYAIPFPRPMIDSPDYDFSFAGLKTSVLYHLNALKRFSRADIAASVQQAIVDVLVAKTVRAAKEYKVKTVIMAGGVAANRTLRKELTDQITALGKKIIIPSPELCTDNAAMIAAVASQTKPTPWQKLTINPNWELGRVYGHRR